MKKVVFIFFIILVSGCAKRTYVDDAFFTQQDNDNSDDTNDKYQILVAVLRDIFVENTDNIIFNNLENKEKIYIAFSKYQKEEVKGKNKYYTLDLEKDYPQEIEGIQFSVKTFDELDKIANKTSTFKVIEPRRLAIMDNKYAEVMIFMLQFPDIVYGDYNYMKLALKKSDTAWIVHKRKIER